MERSEWDQGGGEDGPDTPGPALPPHERSWRHPSEFGRAGDRRADRTLSRKSGAPRALTIAAGVMALVVGSSLLRLMLPGASGSGGNTLVEVNVEATSGPAPSVPSTDPARAPGPTIRPVGTTPTASTTTSTVALPVVLPEAPETVLIEPVGAFAVPLGTDGTLVTTVSAVAGGGSTFEVVLPDGTAAVAVLVATGEELAVLRLERRAGEESPVMSAPELASEFELDDGAWVTVFGSQVSRAVVVRTAEGVALAGLDVTGEWREGSPVVDDRGRVVGLCSRNGGTATLVRTSELDRIRQRAEPAWLGIASAPTAEPSPDSPAPAGVLVLDVVPSGPAAAAGIAPGDDIVALDGLVVTSITQLAELVSARNPGDTVSITLVRHGETLDVVATLGVRPHAT